MAVKLLHGDCRKLIIEAASDGEIDHIITDPPYEISLGGNEWDSTGVAHDPVGLDHFQHATIRIAEREETTDA